MQQTKLIRLLNKLNPIEVKAFSKFIYSPYFNTNDTLIQFWNYLKKYHPEYQHPKLTKEKVHQHFFHNQTFEDKRIRQWCWDLLKLVERFLVQRQLESKPELSQKLLIEGFYQKDLYDRFEVKSKDLIKVIEGNLIEQESNFLELQQLHHNLYFNQRSKKHIANHPNLKGATKNLELYYEINQLKYACEWASRAFRHKEEMPVYFQEKIRLQNKNKTSHLTTLYFNIYNLFQKGFKEKGFLFEETIELFTENIHRVGKRDKISILIHLINYGIAGSRVDDEKYSTIVFDLYKLRYNNESLLFNGQLQEGEFINTIFLGSKTKDFYWVNSFIKQYIDKINSQNKNEIETYANGIIEFYKGNYEDSIEFLEKVRFEKLGRELVRRSLQIRSCFECFLTDDSYYDFVLDKSSSFTKFLKRKEVVSLKKRNAFKNLNRGIKKLTQYHYTNTLKSKLKDLRIEVLAEQEFVERGWILRHLNQLIQK